MSTIFFSLYFFFLLLFLMYLSWSSSLFFFNQTVDLKYLESFWRLSRGLQYFLASFSSPFPYYSFPFFEYFDFILIISQLYFQVIYLLTFLLLHHQLNSSLRDLTIQVLNVFVIFLIESLLSVFLFFFLLQVSLRILQFPIICLNSYLTYLDQNSDCLSSSSSFSSFTFSSLQLDR